MLSDIHNQDIAETLTNRRYPNLEDEIFLTVDKVHALCSVQLQVENGESQLSDQTRHHFAIVLEEQVGRLRELLELHFV